MNWNLPQVIGNNGEPSRARTCDPLIKSELTDTPAGYGSYDLLTSVTGCSRQRVYPLPRVISSLSVFLSQVCLKPIRVRSFVSKALCILDSHGPKRWRYSVETRNAFTISA